MRIAVLDLETDPFEAGKMVHPFVAGFYDGERFISFWHKDCVRKMVEFLNKEPEPWCIFAHNGGRFDFFYFLPYLEKRDVRIINSRLIQCWIGKHELRDSYAIMPFPLEAYHKTEIDYSKFKRNRRNKYTQEIISYLRDDCVDLYTLVTSFMKEFGDRLTIGSASMHQLKSFHKFDSGGKEYDERIRHDFYFGGRNQVFKSGIIRGQTIAVYDVNSMYPSVMRDYLHPVSTGITLSRDIEHNTAFVVVEGYNDGAFPVREKDNSLNFTKRYGRFHTTIHEYNAAIETGAFRPVRIIKTLGYDRRESFGEFVNHFYDARFKAKSEQNKIGELFYKFVLNSAYGKFAQNPENYRDWRVTEIGEVPDEWHTCTAACVADCGLKWTPAFMSGNYIIWERPLQRHSYYNVATGASITGAARAVLLRGIRGAKKPLYTDTDSIICESLHGVPIHYSELGCWKLEATGAMAAICGKKLYAIFDSEGKCIKKAHKGARLTGEEILEIAKGATIESANPVPTFKFDGSHSFTKRRIRKTA